MKLPSPGSIRPLLIAHYGEGKYGASFRPPTGIHRYGEKVTVPRDMPWIDPPPWFLESWGLEAWGDLLAALWKEAGEQPRRPDPMSRAIGKIAAALQEQLTQTAIDVLTNPLPPD